MVQDRSSAIIIITAIFLVLSFLIVSLRCYVRLHILRAFSLDDSLMMVAMTFNIVFCICTFVGATYGIGQKNVWFLERQEHFHVALFCWWLGQLFYILTCVIAKISIVLVLLRVAVLRTHAIILYIVTAANIIVGFLFFFFSIFQCDPVQFFWERMTMQGTCLDADILLGIAYLYTVVAAFTDFTIGLLPAFMVWNLQMDRRTKVSLVVILGLGCVASSAVIIRIPFLQTYRDEDFLYATWQISIWSNIEANLGITAGSMTTLRPLIRLLHDASPFTGGRQQADIFPLSNRITKNHRSFGRIYDATGDEYGTTTVIEAQHKTEERSESEENLAPRNQVGMTIEQSFQFDVS